MSAIYKDLRPETDKKNVYPSDLPPQAYEEIWTRFLSALDPLVQTGKLGALLFQFPPWFGIRQSNKEYMLEVASRCKPLRPVFELRNASWFEGANRNETLDFLRAHGLPFVCVDMPQGYKSSIPPVAEATADLAVVRFHGHSDKWTSTDIHEKFGYNYSRDGAGRVGAQAQAVGRRDVADRTSCMNNCYSRLRPAQRHHAARPARRGLTTACA